MTPDHQPLTKQDLVQALDHFAESLGAEMRTSQESMRAEMRTSLDRAVESLRAEIHASQESMRAEMRTNLDRAVESIAGDFSELRQALTSRMDTLERRFDNQLPIILSIDQRLGALTRQSDRLERDNGAVLSNQAAQQRAFDQLAARVTRLEREIHPEQQ
jgi:CII-binding regulator of phage lambda lysogenization HflD